jgi:hypothetical protein
MRVYLDLCTVQRQFDDQTQRRVREERAALLRIVALIENGIIDLISSFALEFENDENPQPVKREYVETVLSLASDRVEPTASVQARTELYRALGIKTWDATHLAAAVEAEADFFCTCDDRLLRRARAADTGLTRVVSVLELIEEVER